MQDAVLEYAETLFAGLRADEVLLVSYHGEVSDFVRFNRSQVRQAGSVSQHTVSLRLIEGRRHAAVRLELTGERGEDLAGLRRGLDELRGLLPCLPEDPHLLYARQPHDTSRVASGCLPERAAALEAILDAGTGRDLVGIYAAGTVMAAFANSLGQRNRFAAQSFLLDAAFYAQGDKAAKFRYGGDTWDGAALARAADEAAEHAARLAAPGRAVPPGGYRAYFAPAALRGFVQILAWDGFSVKAHRTRTSPLMHLGDGTRRLSPLLTIRNNTADGLAPDFSEEGFVKRPCVNLVEHGAFGEALVSPRSAAEYGLEPTGGGEWPEALDVEGGTLPAADALAALGTGLWIGDVWYLNYSDRTAGRITGMTRFGSFWVEDGRLAAPLNVMRFDDSVYRVLGANLLALTAERAFLPDEHTYLARSTACIRVPGALVADLRVAL